MTTTPIFGLKKPDATDAVKRQDFNDNWDKLDAHTHDLSGQSGIVPVAKGGTGASTPSAARNALGITSPYDYATSAGYTASEATFKADLAGLQGLAAQLALL